MSQNFDPDIIEEMIIKFMLELLDDTEEHIIMLLEQWQMRWNILMTGESGTHISSSFNIDDNEKGKRKGKIQDDS